jgi:peptidylprolyl isomerase
MPDLPAEFFRDALRARRGRHGALAEPRFSANSQFFIMFAPAPHLNGNTPSVGRVVEGMEVVDAIKRGAGQNGAVTGQPDVMESVTVRE